MNARTLHPTPRWRDVVLEQVRIVGLSLRREALIAAVVLGVVTLIIGREIAGGGGSDSRETFPTALVSFLFPFAVWRGEPRFGPAFLWTLPVDRRRLALAKVFAGWVWLMVALAVFVSWVLTLAFLSPATPAAHLLMRIPFTATLAAYLLGSALVLGLRHPLRWLLGTAGVIFLVGALSDVISQPDDREWQIIAGAGAFFSAVERAAAAWLTLPDPTRWTITTFLWFGAGAAALWAAVSRHRERRRQ